MTTTHDNAAQWFYWSNGLSDGTWGWYECSPDAAANWSTLGVAVRLADDLPASRK